MPKSPAWQRAEGKNPEGGLNEKGRASLRAEGRRLKRRGLRRVPSAALRFASG
jgi:hypothetical protein